MFLLSKMLGLVTQPLGWVALLLLAGLITLPRRPVLGRRMVACALLLLLSLGWLPLPDLLLRHLEQQYAEVAPQADLRDYVGLIVLGGATEPGHVAQAHPQPLLNDAAERMTAPIALLRKHPHLRVVFTGGEGDLLGSGPSEAARAQVFFESMGLSGPQMAYESDSRTTYENALLSAQLPGVDTRMHWLLLTSAWHMPRAMATFAKAGWNVRAYPVDYRTGSSTPWTEYSLRKGADHWQLALREMLGFWAYRATGRL